VRPSERTARWQQEIARLGGHYANVNDESIDIATQATQGDGAGPRARSAWFQRSGSALKRARRTRDEH